MDAVKLLFNSISFTIIVLLIQYNNLIMLQDFKKSLRVPDGTTTMRHSLSRATGSLGSLGALFSTAPNKRAQGIPGGRKHNLSKSDEVLDNTSSKGKDYGADSDEEEITVSDGGTTDVSDNMSETFDEKSSPIRRKFHK